MPDPIEQLCRLPLIQKDEWKSTSQIVYESGIRRDRTQFSIDAILRVLRSDPSLIDAWYGYSGNQRVSDGWWFDEGPAGTYVVGRIRGGTIRGDEDESFSDRAEACANFIVKDLAPLVNERWWERIINAWRVRRYIAKISR